jgi:hypothetical protein
VNVVVLVVLEGLLDGDLFDGGFPNCGNTDNTFLIEIFD